MTLCLRFVCFFVCAGMPGQIRLNQIQVIGSHNSYHAGLAPSETAWLKKLNPNAAAALEYRHPGLNVQLSNGVRQVEIDIYADAQGGRYAHPANLKFVMDACLPIRRSIPAGCF